MFFFWKEERKLGLKFETCFIYQVLPQFGEMIQFDENIFQMG